MFSQADFEIHLRTGPTEKKKYELYSADILMVGKLYDIGWNSAKGEDQKFSNV